MNQIDKKIENQIVERIDIFNSFDEFAIKVERLISLEHIPSFYVYDHFIRFL